jgi:predicted metalloprotease
LPRSFEASLLSVDPDDDWTQNPDLEHSRADATPRTRKSQESETKAPGANLADVLGFMATEAIRAEGERACLERRGDAWTIEVRPRAITVQHSRGMAYLARLLDRPGVEIHALDLQGHPASAAGDAGPHLDNRAKSAYRDRITELDDVIDEAQRFNDPERAAAARLERDHLGRELARGVGLGGRDRRAGAAAERARVNVTRAIRKAIRRIAKYDPPLGAHLENSVRTGLFCVYTGSLERPIEWDVESEQEWPT